MNNILQIPLNQLQLLQQEKDLKKPSWIKIKLPKDMRRVNNIKKILRENKLNSVCEEALCPNLTECFNKGTVTFMILGTVCTRKCSFCAVFNGRPNIPDVLEPKKLAKVISDININFVVITSVNRDDLKDGGSKHFLKCIQAIRSNKNVKIEILVPDFRNCVDIALNNLTISPPDIFNHNLENVPRLYKKIRPGANYYQSLKLLERFRMINPNVPTKSGLMLGLGETDEEIIQVMKDLRLHGVTMLTLGQYLQPSIAHTSIKRYITPKEFKDIQNEAKSLGFVNVFSGPLVRSSYHADIQFLRKKG
ncbi:lipoate synthase [Buchnera aphidicola (Nipponaphis monzeni)]|uniref:Lipoyl synthase n=1 Tax=Buchnera aphidicola (Nipponaphis monzeni) TaxID=2495405 RepID=A0A455TA58_9GAMM|nr:lipoate synthase [Buchnera aphidicola (Nipponaphis monzeni)]